MLVLAGVCLGVWGLNRLGGWRFTLHRLHTESAWPTFTQRMSQLERLPLGPRGLVFLGDSHVAYAEWSELLPMQKTYNRGVPGAGIEDVRAFAKTIDLSVAEAVILQIGTNDVLFHDVEEVERRYSLLLDELQVQLSSAASAKTAIGAGNGDFAGQIDSNLSPLDSAFANTRQPARLIVCTLPGVNNDVRWTGIHAVKVHAINEFLRKQAAQRGLPLCDVAALLESHKAVLPPRFSNDGVHLRGEAYARWAQRIAEYLVPGTTFAH